MGSELWKISHAMSRKNRRRAKSGKLNQGDGRGNNNFPSHFEARPTAGSGSGIFAERTWAGIADSLHLSGRELQIVRGVFDNRTELAIAADLSISPHTVHSHFRRLHQKLGVVNRVELVLRVVNQFFTSSPTSRKPMLGLGSARRVAP